MPKLPSLADTYLTMRVSRFQGLYLSVMDALYPINPAALFFIEGCGQTGLGANW